MRCKLLVPVLLALFFSGPASAQAVKDPATLMPAKVLAYAEIREVGALAKEIGGLFKGSALSNVPDSLQKIRGKFKENDRFGRRQTEELGIAGMFLAPEVIAELGRVQGAAVAFTGMSDRLAPQYLAVVLPGESNAPSFFFRMFMTMAPTKKVETVQGVTIYGMVFERDELPVFAMAPGALFVGSKDNVKDAILRLKGKFDGPSLAENKTLVEIRKHMGDKPGLLSYAEPAELFKLTENLPLGRGEKEVFAAIEKAVNPKAFRAIAQGWALEQGTLSCREIVLLDPNEKSPILDVLPMKAVNPDLLHFAPKDAIFAAAIDNSAGEKRFESLVAIIDSVTPDGFKFSDGIKAAEKALEIEIGKDILGQISSAVIAMGDPLKVKIKTVEEIGPNFRSMHSSPEVPVVIIIRANNPKAAEKLMKFVPIVFAAGRGPIEPTTTKVEGRELSVLKMSKYSEAYYGREGATIVVGPFGTPVARSLNAGAKRLGLMSDPQTADRLKEMEKAQAVGCVKLVGVVAASLMVTGRSMATAKAREDKNGDKEEPKKPEIKVSYSSPLDDPIVKEISKILADEEFFVLGLERTKTKIQIDGQVTGLNRIIPRLVDFAVEMTFRRQAGFGIGDADNPPRKTVPKERFKDFDK